MTHAMCVTYLCTPVGKQENDVLLHCTAIAVLVCGAAYVIKALPTLNNFCVRLCTLRLDVIYQYA